ncbi:unnamed protein product [Arabidopsis arenosa]|uniref:Uncharacterized protein n=1 Tax=Arabidopsis arenosa TaxID=38785 RepID=A0A8S2A475_ARAAE|nr:unnamed protein product [Arabidopsis arenosa]
MVKRGGTKTKIAIKKIMKKSSLRPICTKRREGLFSKASQLDGVISAFLSGKRPQDNKEMRDDDVGVCLTRKDLGLGFWWEDKSLNRSEDPQELSDAMESMWTLLSNLKKFVTVLVPITQITFPVFQSFTESSRIGEYS